MRRQLIQLGHVAPEIDEEVQRSPFAAAPQQQEQEKT